ncbi:MAG: hypothetical protein IT486_06990 [Gammaproteobacteria bacterium]|nr:hypothetical protein [Gammaproteobacteria bacterium]
MAGENERFDAAATVIATAQTHGIRSLMLSTHPGYAQLLTKAASTMPDHGRFEIAPVVPYPHTINNIIAQDGYSGVLKRFGLRDVAAVTADALRIVGLPGRNEEAKLERAFKLIIDVELSCILGIGFSVRHVCLHNIVTDLLLSFGRFDVLQGFINACSRMGLRAVLITQNPAVMLAAPLLGPFVACFSYNKLGYMVNPSLEKTIEAIKAVDRSNCEMWAMQILAGGAIAPESALQDEALAHFDSILYATTRPGRIEEFVKLIGRSFPQSRTP